MQVIVLGMHRSGTSVLARMLNLMGLYLGPEGMSTGANPENPKGFWERRDVRLLNDALLHSTGHDWDRVSSFDLDAVPDEMVSAFDEVASRTVLEMDAHRPWFVKEPRLCLLLPAWLRHLEVPVIVNVYRDPVEVAASMLRRNGIPLETGLELWEYYVRSAARAASGLPAISVLHSGVMTDPEGVASHLYRELGRMGVEGIRPATSREVAGFIDPGLHRQRGGRDGLERYRDSRQALLYKQLAEGDTGALLHSPPQDWPALMDYEKGLPVLQTPKPRHVRASGYDVFMLDQRLKSNVRSVGRLESRLTEKLDERLAELEQKVVGAGGDQKSQGLSEHTNAGLDEAIAQRERAERELAQRYVELAEAARELAAAAQREKQRDAECERLAAEAAEAEESRQETSQLKMQRDGDASTIRKLNKKIADQDNQLLRHRRERRRLFAALEDERKLLARAQDEIALLTASRSWRLTRPLRWLARKLGSLRG